MDEDMSPNAEGKTAVDLGVHGTIHIPEGHADPTVRYETPDGVKHEWTNPDASAPQVVTDPGPDDDVVYDASVKGYVPRVHVAVADGGAGAESGTAG